VNGSSALRLRHLAGSRKRSSRTPLAAFFRAIGQGLLRLGFPPRRAWRGGQGVRFRARISLVSVALVLIVTACGQVPPLPTATPAPPTPLPASPTVNPVMPLAEGQQIRAVPLGDAGSTNPTQAALPAEGEPAQAQPTVTPQPTQAELPMLISASDGLVLRGTYYGAPARPAPGVLMLHQQGSDRSSWDDLARRVQAAGYAVLTVDLRGSGETGGAEDWTLALSDVRQVLDTFVQLPGVSPGRIVVIGASIGANLGLNACADLAGCAGAVLLSPGLDYASITTADAMPRLGARPVLIVASENDNNNPADSLALDGMASGDHQLTIYPAAGHGTDMFAAEPGLFDLIAAWLEAHVPPPGP
jgi:dienelactone hydrolase